MAKRTNKTDHVLNLLSGNKKNQNHEEEKQAPPVEPRHKDSQEENSEPQEEQSRQTSEEKEPANISVVEHSADEDNPIAESVKNSLEEEMDRYMERRQEQEGAESAEFAAEPDFPEEPILEKEEPVFEEEESIPETAPREAPEPPTEEPPKPDEADEADDDGQPAGEEEPESEKVEPEMPEPEPEAQEERTFAVVNVMEHLVRDKAEGYMRQFQNCTCSRCVEDTIALALTNLPAKYVVVNKDTISPLLNFYEKQYAGQITVEITKACIKVKDNPRH